MSTDSDPVSGTEGDEQGPRLRAPLMFALKSGDLNEIHRLLSSGADLNSPGRMTCLSKLQPPVPSYPLIWAVDGDDLEAVRLLLDNGADPNICCEYIHRSRACWLRPLCHATHPDIVTLLLDAGAEVNAQQRPHTGTETALLRASQCNPSVGEVLVERGADVNIASVSGGTPLYRAVIRRHYGLAARLVQAGAEVDRYPAVYSVRTPLMLAVRSNAPNSLIHLLLQSGADPNHRDDKGRTVLHWTAREMNVWAIKWLIAENVDLEAPDGDPGKSQPVSQYLLDLCDKTLTKEEGSVEDITCGLNTLRVIQMLALAWTNNVRNCSLEFFIKQTRKLLIERLDSFISKSVDYSNAPSFLTFVTEDLQEIHYIVNTLVDMLSEPFSLMHLCRIQIRRSVGRDFHRKLLQLNVPLPLQDYLMVYKQDHTPGPAFTNMV